MMHIRRATVADASTLSRLTGPVQTLHAHAYPQIFKQPFDDDAMTHHYEQVLTSASNYVFIGEVDGEAVGYVQALIVVRPENVFTFALEYINIDQISVNPEHQGKGYGTQLTGYVFELARAKGISRVTLTVWMFNTQAIRFYEKLGFSRVLGRMEINLV
jgi:diamine N-acetyltransferase